MSSSPSTRNKIQTIQEIIGQDDGDRGMKALIVPGDLEKAATFLTSLLSQHDDTTNQPKPCHIVILSGFPCCVDQTPPTETDGPPGTIAIAKCILALGKHHHVTIVTDDCNKVVFEAAIGNEEDEAENSHEKNTIQLETFPPEQHMKEEDYNRMKLISSQCDLLVACERAGPGSDGKCYTMRGIDMTAKGLIAPLHQIVDMIRNKPQKDQKKVYFIAIGDGGNELGMGKVIDKIRTNPKIPNGNLIGAVTSADYLIAASVSNWGGYALAAACALVKSDMQDDEGEQNLINWVGKCVPTTQHEIDLLDRCVNAGCRDGVSGKMESTVDGMPLQTSLDCLQKIITCCLKEGE